MANAGSEQARAAIAKVQQLLHKRLKVTLVGGRMLLGDLQCLDKQGNLILGNTVEQLAHIQQGSNERVMGTVLVPLAQQQRIELLVALSDKTRMLQIVA